MAWKHRTHAQELLILDLYGDRSIAQVAAVTGVSKWTVGDVLRKYHVPLRWGRSYASATFRYAYDRYAWGRMIEYLYWEERLPLAETAARLGVAVSTLRTLLRGLRAAACRLRRA